MTSMFEKLICSDCKKYLSVFPIKVYPNRQVKCGRCWDGGGGIVSKLYETIAQELKFPCINIYEGCTTVLEPKEMLLHEEICGHLGTRMMCPVCFNFQADSFTVVQHFKQAHKKNFLKFPEFTILFNDDDEEKYYLYASDSEHILTIIFVRYDHIVNTLYLDIAPICMETEHDTNFKQKFKLFSVKNEMVYKSSERECIRYIRYSGTSLSNNSNGIVIKDKYFNNVAVCKFSIEGEKKIQFKRDVLLSKNSRVEGEHPLDARKLTNDNEPKIVVKEVPVACSLKHYSDNTNEPKVVVKEIIKKVPIPCTLKHYIEPKIIVKEVPTSCSLKHFPDNSVSNNDIMPLDLGNSGTQTIVDVFENIRQLQETLSPIFYIANSSWRILLRKQRIGNNTYLGVFLNKEDNELESKYSCKVNAEFSLLTVDGKDNEVKSFGNRIFGKRPGETMSWGWKDFISWSILLDPQKKFVERNDDDIEVELKITVEKVFEHKKLCSCLGCCE